MKGEWDCIEEGGIADEGGVGLYRGGGIADASCWGTWYCSGHYMMLVLPSLAVRDK